MKRLRTIRLLVVEDNPAYIYLIQKAFQARHGCCSWQLTTAKDGAQALQFYSERNRVWSSLTDVEASCVFTAALGGWSGTTTSPAVVQVTGPK